MKTVEEWGSGSLTKAIFRCAFSKGKEIKCCDTCDQSKGPFSTSDIQDQYYCKRTHNYEKPTHYCAEWKEKENASE